MPAAETTEQRALRSGGTSADPIYAMAVEVLEGRHPGGGFLLDVGCGHGNLRSYVQDRFERYAGADVVRYPSFSNDAEFYPIDLDNGRIPLADGSVDVVASVETIEHLENPRAFAREMTRLCRPGGWMLITTPNQLSFLSKLTFFVKNKFNAFTDSSYPAHINALLEIDLRRIALECGWTEVHVVYSKCGRVPGTARHWPTFLSRLLPRAMSDNVCIIGRKV
ncbi:MAG: class I SAM-dependent methyltransferase [Planctomycetia bacterium]|nr:class I SAM-dependent methyltransferase [Planctomycetia bacterium]